MSMQHALLHDDVACAGVCMYRAHPARAGSRIIHRSCPQARNQPLHSALHPAPLLLLLSCCCCSFVRSLCVRLHPRWIDQTKLTKLRFVVVVLRACALLRCCNVHTFTSVQNLQNNHPPSAVRPPSAIRRRRRCCDCDTATLRHCDSSPFVIRRSSFVVRRSSVGGRWSVVVRSSVVGGRWSVVVRR